MPSYHNTLNLKNTSKEEAQCNRQEAYVYRVFKANEQGLTADEVFEIVAEAKNLADMPFWDAVSKAISMDKSIRRSISNLVDKHYLLVKTDKTRVGRSGKDNSIYRLK